MTATATDTVVPGQPISAAEPPPLTLAERIAAARRDALDQVALTGTVATVSDDTIFMLALRPVLAACIGVNPTEFTPGDAWDETDELAPTTPAPYPTPVAKRACGTCPIRTSCLAYALRHHEVGTWGGTTEYQRRLLRRPRARTLCPYCGSDMLGYETTHEVCIMCGMSWPIPATAEVQS